MISDFCVQKIIILALATRTHTHTRCLWWGQPYFWCPWRNARWNPDVWKTHCSETSSFTQCRLLNKIRTMLSKTLWLVIPLLGWSVLYLNLHIKRSARRAASNLNVINSVFVCPQDGWELQHCPSWSELPGPNFPRHRRGPPHVCQPFPVLQLHSRHSGSPVHTRVGGAGGQQGM